MLVSSAGKVISEDDNSAMPAVSVIIKGKTTGTSTDANGNYSLSVSTSQSSGLLGNLMNSVMSGEGMVLRFSGKGKVVICSRNRQNLLAWLQSKLSPRSNQ